VPLLPARPAAIQPEAYRGSSGRCTHLFLSLPIVAPTSAPAARTAPLPRDLAAGWSRVRCRTPGLTAGAIACFPKAVYLAERLAAKGSGTRTRTGATHPALAAYAIAGLSEVKL